jgi:hypothetical protein
MIGRIFAKANKYALNIPAGPNPTTIGLSLVLIFGTVISSEKLVSNLTFLSFKYLFLRSFSSNFKTN